MTTKKATPTLRKCSGSARFGIEPHEAPTSDFPVQPSRPDGLGTMCRPHWKAYVKGLREARIATKDGKTAAKASAPTKAATKRERRKTPMAHIPARPESPRVRKARAIVAATETLAGTAYTEAVGSVEVQAALETLNGGHVEPVEVPLGESTGATEEADAA